MGQESNQATMIIYASSVERSSSVMSSGFSSCLCYSLEA